MNIKISPITYLFYALMLLISHDRTIVAGVSAVLIHESAHLAVIALCGCQINRIDVTPIGLSIQRIGITSHLQDVAIHIAGPMANLAVAGLFAIACQNTDLLPVSANLFFGLLNLIPIETLDGGKVLSALLARRLSISGCQFICQSLSKVFMFILWMLSAASLLMLEGSPSLLVFCVGLFIAQLKDNQA